MLTPRESAPLGPEATGGRPRPSRRPALDLKVIHRIAELEIELLQRLLTRSDSRLTVMNL